MNGHASINRLYRLVWSQVHGGWIAVAENARGRGKASSRRRLLAALFAGAAVGHAAADAPAPAQLPTGGKVLAGSIGMTQSGARLDVNQASQRGVVQWDSFNVGARAQVNFNQASSSAVTLNRVMDTQASQIFGRITANGQVFLTNPNGIYFSPTASVDVGGLLATTHQIGTADFMAGKSVFTRDGATGSVVNDGSLNASLGGYIALLAPEVRNRGIVTAQAGTVALASGEAVELHFSGSRTLAGVVVSKAEIDALVDNGGAVRAPEGLIVMSAQAASQLQSSIVRNTGTLEATGLASSGGRIVLDGSGLVDHSGSSDVSGAKGGSIVIHADRLLSAGTLRADGKSQGGGSIVSTLGESLIETSSALLSATGGGGAISVDAGAQVYTSGSYDASGLAAGQRGGSVTVTGDKLALMGASVNANGHDGGGSVLIGGDLHGANASTRNAKTTTIGTGVKFSADATAAGNGGKVVVWADDTTTFAGSVSAKGGLAAGDGGQLEVSGKGTLHFAGSGDASAPRGKAGTLLLDPKNIFIDDQVTAQVEYVDPHSTAAGTFGASVTPLTTTTSATVNTSGTITGTTAYTGYVVITNPTDTLGATDGGAAYLFRRSDQALISTLYGTHSGDRVGANVTPLTNGSFVVGSPAWNNGRGAATWGSGTLGWGSGATVAVSSSNSLIGSLAPHADSQGLMVSDKVGDSGQVKALVTGNYLVVDSGWGNSVGAVAFGNGTTGSSGTIGAANALVGSTVKSQAAGQYLTYKNGDGIGGGITYLPNGNYVITDYLWNMGVGSVTLGSGTSGVSGVVSASNSLVGTSSRSDATGNGSGTDKVGYRLQVLNGSEFVVYTSAWNTGNSTGSAGALTWSNGSTMAIGQVSASNSLVGTQGDYFTSAGLTLLPSNNAYVVSSPSWNSGLGAATWIAIGSDPKSIDIASSSVAGGTNGDAVGSKAVTLLANGDYVLSSPGWQSGKGAVTLVDAATGKTKSGQASTVTASNSIVGSQTTDNVGQQGIVELVGSGNFVALSPNWSDGGTSKVGAVTWSSGSTPTVGVVSSSNSLVGSYANDRIGEVQYNTYGYGGTVPNDNQNASVTVLANGNYVVASPMWNSTRGAVTLGNGSTGTAGAVTAANSLVGSSVGDYVGSFSSPIAAANPTPAYFYLGNGVQGLANGNFVVVSDFWKNGSAARAGAVTWSSGSSSPTVGAVSSANSIVGSTANDLVGYNNGANGVKLLFAGYDGSGNKLGTSNYVIASSHWDNGATADAGAVTWGSGGAGSSGAISTTNSVVGTSADEMKTATVQPLASGNYLILDTLRDVGPVQRAGALTLMSGSTGRVSDYAANGNQNLVSATNSLVGSTSDDFYQAYLVPLYTVSSATGGRALETGNFVLSSYYWDNGGLADAGAVTWGSGTSGVSGTITRVNSVIGEKAGDYLGNYFTALPTGDYVVGNPTRDIGNVVNAGAASWVSGANGHLSDYAANGNQNIVSASNSMVGSHPEDRVGDGVYSFYDAISDYNRTGYFIFSTGWNCLAGALTYVIDGSVPVIGTVGATNSAVGDPNGHFVGGLGYSPYPALVPNTIALATFAGDGGHVYEVTPTMPGTGGMAIANATNFGDAAGATQMIAPDYVAGVLRTGTSLTLQASNDILVRGSIDATGGTAGGSLTLDAGRSIAVLGDIITGNRNLTLVANDTLAHGVVDAQRDPGIATISMGSNPQGHTGVIDAGSGSVSITMAAGADKTNHMGGSIGLNTVTAASITVVNRGNGLGTLSDLPTLADCCGFLFGTQTPGANIVLNTGAVLHATGTGTAVSLAADGQFSNGSGNTTGSIVLTDPSARWLVYAAAPGMSASFGGLDSGNTAVWNQVYDPNGAVGATGNRYVFAYQPTVTVGTQNVGKTYGDDLTSTLASSVLSLSGAQAGVSGAYLGDTLSSAVTGSATVSSAGAAATAGVAAGPYVINVDLSGITGNNGYAVALGSNTPRTITVAPKTLTAALTGVSKTYDSTAVATLINANYTLAGLVNGDTFDVTKTSGTFDAANVTASSASTTLTSSDFTGQAGALRSNYTLPTSASGAATITPKALTGALASLTKTYDGSTAATIGSGQLTLTGFVGGQSATVGASSGAYNSADVLAASSVSVTLVPGDVTAGSGTTLANYVLPASVTGIGSITPKALTAALSGAFSKTYDGTTAVTLNASNVTLTGVVGGQSVTLSNAQGAFDAATVAGASSVVATLATQDFAAGSGTLLSNYQLPTSASGNGSITRASLTVTANSGSRSYDGTSFSGGGVAYSGFVNGETSAVLGGALSYGGSAQGALNAGSYTVVPSGYSAANYSIGYIAGTQAITPVQLTAQLVGSFGKTYDATSAASLSGANVQLAGFVGSEGATLGGFTGTYDGVNAGAHTVAATLSPGNFTASGATLLSNYVLPTSASGGATISPRSLTLTAPSISKVYDGSTAYATSAADLSALSASLLGTDAVSAASFVFGDKNAGAGNRVVNFGGVTIDDGNGGANYSVTLAGSTSGSITPRVLAVSAAVGNRIYDGSTAATVSFGDDRIAGDALSVSGNAQFADKNAGGAKPVNVTGLALAGSDAGNYALASNAASATATITPAMLTIGGVAAVNRSYDAGTSVALTGTPTITPLGNDVVTLSGNGAGTMTDKNVGQHKAVGVAGYTISDPNYTLVQPQGLTVDITPALLAVSGVAAVNRTYDAGTVVALTGAPMVTPLGNDVVAVSGHGTGALTDKNAGQQKPVIVAGYTIADPNYMLLQPQGVTVDVAPATLVISGVTAVNRTYDAGTGVQLTGLATVTPLGNDVVTLSGSGTGTLADKNAGQHKAVTVGGYTIDDANYLLQQPQGVTADIAPAVLTLAGLTVHAGGKTYDGTRTVLLGGAPATVGVGGETVTVSGAPTGQMADKNVGTAKPVLVGGLVSNDPNYVVGQQPGLQVDVTPAALSVSGITANNKSFDGNSNASLSGTARLGALSGDEVTLAGSPTASFVSATVGKGKEVDVVGYTLAGADHGNYSLQAIALTADIVAAPAEAPPLPVLPNGLPGLVVNPVLSMPSSSAGLLSTPLSNSVASPVAATAADATATPAASPRAERAPSTTTEGILVSLVRTPSTQQSGEVTVSVPQQIAQDARGFAFTLPAALLASAAAQGTEVKAAALDGGPLPGWIHYEAQTGSFSVSNPPAGALPLRVSLTIGNQQTTLVVTAQ